MEIALISLSLLCLALVAATLFLLKTQNSQNSSAESSIRLQEQAKAKEDVIAQLRDELGKRELQIQTLQAELQNGNSQIATLKTELSEKQKIFAEKLGTLQEAEKKLVDTFQALSSEALQKNNSSFLQLAKESLEKHQNEAKSDLKTRQEAIDALVKPLKESLQKVDEKIHHLEKNRQGAYEGLMAHLENLGKTQERLQLETGNLVNALKAPQVRGRWGEMTLKRVAELAGMTEYCDFVEQEHVATENGALRPDMVVKLPQGKQIVVDAKTPLLGYIQALEAKDDNEKKQHLAQHARHIQKHMKDLGSKSYWNDLSCTPEFVVMFIPGESFLSAALKDNPNLYDEGMQNGVILATPTTLISILKTSAHVWRQEQLAENAEQISKMGQELYERIAVMAEHFQTVGQNLTRATDAYNKTIGSLERNVLSKARQFKELGVSSKRQIERLPTSESSVRNLSAPELLLETNDDIDLSSRT